MANHIYDVDDWTNQQHNVPGLQTGPHNFRAPSTNSPWFYVGEPWEHVDLSGRQSVLSRLSLPQAAEHPDTPLPRHISPAMSPAVFDPYGEQHPFVRPGSTYYQMYWPPPVAPHQRALAPRVAAYEGNPSLHHFPLPGWAMTHEQQQQYFQPQWNDHAFFPQAHPQPQLQQLQHAALDAAGLALPMIDEAHSADADGYYYQPSHHAAGSWAGAAFALPPPATRTMSRATPRPEDILHHHHHHYHPSHAFPADVAATAAAAATTSLPGTVHHPQTTYPTSHVFQRRAGPAGCCWAAHCCGGHAAAEQDDPTPPLSPSLSTSPCAPRELEQPAAAPPASKAATTPPGGAGEVAHGPCNAVPRSVGGRGVDSDGM